MSAGIIVFSSDRAHESAARQQALERLFNPESATAWTPS